MPDDIDQLRTFRADTPGPSTAAWTRAEEAIAAARRGSEGRRIRWQPGWRVLTALVAAPVLAAAVLVAVALHPTATVTPGNATSPRATASADRDLAWSLAGYLTPKGWQLDTRGPVPGPMTCPTATTCYVEGDTAGLYVSTDEATTWQSITLPAGLAFTTALVCQSATTCEAGATEHGTPVLTVTKNSGRSWTSQRLPTPAADGTINTLTCTAPSTCRAIIYSREQAQGKQAQGKQAQGKQTRGKQTQGGREHLLTTDDGRHFTVSYFPANNIYLLSCPTASHCVAEGLASDLPGAIIGQILVSDNGGASWRSETMTAGLRPWGSLECVDAEHCVQSGLHIQGDYTVFMVSDDGGVTWTVRPVPADLPGLGIDNIACVSVSTCYITGWDDKPQRFDGGHAVSGSTAIAAVTQNAGLTWQPIGLPEPSKLPALEPPDVFMSVSSLQCPQVNTCIALADNIAGNKYAAIYKTGP
jgi:photosystem II stability/assembly factor-like uncharacterized protein